MQRSDLQASNPARQYAQDGERVRLARQLGYEPEYPQVPAMWPNRAVRRAVRHGSEGRIPAEWRHAMSLHQGLRAAIRAL